MIENEKDYQDTAYASKFTYDVENIYVSGGENPNTDQSLTTDKLQNEGLPSNLEYLDSFHDDSTGTSGTAFRDKDTG